MTFALIAVSATNILGLIANIIFTWKTQGNKAKNDALDTYQRLAEGTKTEFDLYKEVTNKEIQELKTQLQDVTILMNDYKAKAEVLSTVKPDNLLIEKIWKEMEKLSKAQCDHTEAFKNHTEEDKIAFDKMIGIMSDLADLIQNRKEG